MNERPGPGETIQRQEFEKKVSYVTAKLTQAGVFDPSPEQQSKMPQRMKEVFGYLGHGAKKVSDFGTSFNDNEDKEILGQAAFKVVQKMAEKDSRWNDALVRGSDYMNSLIVVPELKGLGHRIAKILVPDADINASLNRLQAFRLKLNTGGAKDAAEYVSVVEAKIESIKTNFTDDKVKGQARLVLEGLKHERVLAENREINFKVVEVTKKLKEAGIINPSKEQKDVRAQKMKEVFEYLGHGTRSVREIEYTINSNSATEKQKNNAEKDKKILSRAIDWATRGLDKTNPSLKNDLFMGSKHVDNMLADELKGLGREISKNYVSNQKIDEQLNLLEVTRKNIDYKNLDNVRTFSEKINKTRNNIIGMNFEDEKEVLQQDEVSTVLNSEQRRLAEVTQSGQRVTETTQNNNENRNRTAQERRDRELKEAELRALRGPQEPSEGDDNGSKKEQNHFYFMTQDDLIDLDMTQRNKDQFHFNPPYPSWFKELKSFDEQKLWLLECKLINGVAYKQALRNIDAEKLFGNRALDITNEEMRLLCNMEGFQKTLKMIFDDLFVWENEVNGGDRFLKLKQRELTADEIEKKCVGKPLDREVEKILTDNTFESYKEKLALKLQYPDKNKKEIDELYNKLYSEKKRASNKYRRIVALAWDTAYIGNVIESADGDRQLKPTEIVSDKLRTMIHPMQKAMGKWGVFKQGKESIDGINGEEEPMGGDIASWIRYHLELGDIRENNKFRQKLLNGEIQPLPRRAACSLLEMYMVNVEGQEGKMTMAEAIMKGKKIVFVNKKDDPNSRGGDLDIFSDFRDMMDGCKTAYTYLTGTAKLEVGKSEYEWARKFNADIALIRQMNGGKKRDGRVNTLEFVNEPEFIAWVIASSAGFDIEGNGIVLNFKSIGANSENYDIAVKKIINLPDLVSLGSRDGKIEQILNADRGWFGTTRMLGNHGVDIMMNRAAVKKHNEKIKRESGSSGRDYRRYGDR